QPHCLAVALRARHAEIVTQPALGDGALLLTDDADAFAAKPAEPADDRLVLAELAIARERREIGHQRTDVVEAVGPFGMARDLGLLPGRQLGIEVFQRLQRLRLEPHDLLADRDAVAARLDRAQFLDLGFEFRHRLFEVEIAAHSSRGPAVEWIKRRWPRAKPPFKARRLF